MKTQWIKTTICAFSFLRACTAAAETVEGFLDARNASPTFAVKVTDNSASPLELQVSGPSESLQSYLGYRIYGEAEGAFVTCAKTTCFQIRRFTPKVFDPLAFASKKP